MKLSGRIYQSLLLPIKDFIYPPLCLTCPRLLSPDEELVCSACWDGFRRVPPPQAELPAFLMKFPIEARPDGFLACFHYEGGMADAIHYLKYRKGKAVGLRLGRELGKLISRMPFFADAELIVPVPLHRLARRERGYNQSECIMAGIEETTGIRGEASLLLRNRYCASQTGLGPEERRLNVEGVFQVRQGSVDRLKGRKILLVDDVVTTGCTACECVRALKNCGAGSVAVAAAALAGRFYC